MDNPLLDRMKRRQRDHRADTLQRWGMVLFITAVVSFALADFLFTTIGQS